MAQYTGHLYAVFKAVWPLGQRWWHLFTTYQHIASKGSVSLMQVVLEHWIENMAYNYTN